MNYYETIIIFDTEKYKNSDNIQQLIQGYMGKTYKVKREDIGIKKLAYEIKEHKQGYYVQFIWSTKEEDATCDLERHMRTDDSILKFITVKLDDMHDDIPIFEPFEHEHEEESKQLVDLLDIIYGLN